MIDRLDFNAAPPGFMGDRCGIFIRPGTGTRQKSRSLVQAWAEYQAERDPPGLRVCERPEPLGFYWSTPNGSMRDAGFPCQSHTARARAWAWYRECVELDASLRVLDEARPHTFTLLQAVECWPRCLDWPADYVPELRKWLVDGEGIPRALGIDKLSKGLATQIGYGALAGFLLRCEDASRIVASTTTGFETCNRAVMSVLDKLEPGRWQATMVMGPDRGPRLTINERVAEPTP